MDSVRATHERLATLRALIAQKSQSRSRVCVNRSRGKNGVAGVGVPCRFYARGKCTNARCAFVHDPSVLESKLPRKLSDNAHIRLQQLQRVLNANKKKSCVSSVKDPVQMRLKTLQKLLVAGKRRRPLSFTPVGIAKTPRNRSENNWVREGLQFSGTKCHDGFEKKISAPRTKAARISINGVLFKLDPSNRKMTRVHASTSATSHPSKVNHKPAFIPSHVNVDGVAFVKSKTGTSLVRSSMQSTRAYASSKLKSSLQFVRAQGKRRLSKRKKEQFCMFFNRFGKCQKGSLCPFVHDPSKIGVCRQFLVGKCFDSGCLLSHCVAREKMPVCSYFLAGVCELADKCPYSHVRVNPHAEVCPDFLKGFCPQGLQCKLKHSYKRANKGGENRKNLHVHANEERKEAEEVAQAFPLPTTTTTADSGAGHALRIRPRLDVPKWPLSS